MAHPDVEDLKAALTEDWRERVFPWANLLDDHQKCVAANLHVCINAWKRGARGKENGQLILKYAREVWEMCPILLDRCGNEIRDPDLIFVALALYEAEAEGEIESVIRDGVEMFRPVVAEHPGYYYEDKKCRCKTCRLWHRKRMRKCKADRYSREPPERVHGTTGGYSNWGCRCPRCALAWRRQMRERERTGSWKAVHSQANPVTSEEARAEMRVAA